LLSEELYIDVGWVGHYLNDNLTGGCNWLDVNWYLFSLSGCLLYEGKDLVGVGKLSLGSCECGNMVETSCCEFFIRFWLVEGCWHVVDVSWVGDIKVSKEWVVNLVLVIFVYFIVERLVVERKCISVVLSVSL
jgi:hypothetical protein